jgi:hypothetical protein
VHVSQLLHRSLDLLGCSVGVLEAQHQLVLREREPGSAIDWAAPGDFWVERKSRVRVPNPSADPSADRPGSNLRAGSGVGRSVIVVLDDDVAMTVHRPVVRTLDDDDIVTMMPAPMMAIAVVVEGLASMPAMMEATAVLIDDDCLRTMMMSVLVRGQNDRIGRGNRRRRQAKCQRAQNQGGFHNQVSENLSCPSPPKHRCHDFVPVSKPRWQRARTGGGYSATRHSGSVLARAMGLGHHSRAIGRTRNKEPAKTVGTPPEAADRGAGKAMPVY